MPVSKTVTEGGRLLHRADCTCAVCQELRDGTVCEACGGPVLVVESDRAYRRTCQHCGATGTVPKSEVECFSV